MKAYSITKKRKDGSEYIKSVSELIGEIERREADRIVALKTDAYGTYWIGKAKFVFGALNFATLHSPVHGIEQNGNDLAIYTA